MLANVSKDFIKGTFWPAALTTRSRIRRLLWSQCKKCRINFNPNLFGSWSLWNWEPSRPFMPWRQQGNDWINLIIICITWHTTFLQNGAKREKTQSKEKGTKNWALWNPTQEKSRRRYMLPHVERLFSKCDLGHTNIVAAVKDNNFVILY